MVRQATLRAIRCTTSPMDLVCVQLAGGRYVLLAFFKYDETGNCRIILIGFFFSIYSFLSAGWGFISDVDIESEKLRWMGDTRYQESMTLLISTRDFRFSLWSAYALANLKLYRGRLSYLQVLFRMQK